MPVDICQTMPMIETKVHASQADGIKQKSIFEPNSPGQNILHQENSSTKSIDYIPFQQERDAIGRLLGVNSSIQNKPNIKSFALPQFQNGYRKI